MALLPVIALACAVAWFWGFGGLLLLSFAIVCLVVVSAICDAITLRQRALDEGRQAGSLWLHLQEAWRIASKKEQSTSATVGACPAPESQMPRRSDRKRKTQAVKGHLPHCYRFSYRDSGGAYTQRTVNVLHVSQQGHRTYLEGYCELRKATRTFGTDGIRGKLTDMETGEVITLKCLLSLVPQRSQMRESPIAPAKPLTSNADGGWQTAVLFTGFSASRRDELEQMAEAAGWQVRTAVSSTLDYLVTGPSAGPSKIAQAQGHGIAALQEADFLAMLGQ